MSNQPITIAIADRHDIFREGLTQTLPALGYKVISSCPTGTALLIELRNGKILPDVCLMDVRNMEGMISSIKTSYPDLKIIACSTNQTEEFKDGILQSGADGFVLKWLGLEKLLEEINRVTGLTKAPEKPPL